MWQCLSLLSGTEPSGHAANNKKKTKTKTKKLRYLKSRHLWLWLIQILILSLSPLQKYGPQYFYFTPCFSNSKLSNQVPCPSLVAAMLTGAPAAKGKKTWKRSNRQGKVINSWLDFIGATLKTFSVKSPSGCRNKSKGFP